MAQEHENLDAVIAEYVDGQPKPPESLVIAIGKNGQLGQPGFWNRRDFRQLRVTSRRNRTAVASILLPGLSFRDRDSVTAQVNVHYIAWCEQDREQALAIGIAKHTRPGMILRDVNDRIEDWLKTEVQGRESVFLSSLLAGDACLVIAQHVQDLAATHFGLSTELTFEVAGREKLHTISLDPVVISAFPSGFARSKVQVTVRADVCPTPGRDLLALASAVKAPSFREYVREEASRVIETSITLDELTARQPVKAREAISEALNRRLAAEGWQLLNLDLRADWKAVPPEVKVSQSFTFQLSGLAREWTGQINFLAYPKNQAFFFSSGHSVETMPDWIRQNALRIATRTMSRQTFKTIVSDYDGIRLVIKTDLEELLRVNGYATSGFTVTTNLPIESLSGVIRTPEQHDVELATVRPNQKVRMTYHVEYAFRDLSQVQDKVTANEDVPQSVAAAVDQAIRDQLRKTQLLDFYFDFESVSDALRKAIQERLNGFGAVVRSYLLTREDDDVLSRIAEMAEPARQGAVEPFDITHPRLDTPVHIQTLVFTAGEFSRDHFYQFVVTKPRMEQVQDSIKTHCEQWLADVPPNVFLRVANSQLLKLFQEFVVPRIQREFGITVAISNFILGRHEEVLAPPAKGGERARDLKMLQEALKGLRPEYQRALVTGDSEAAAIKKRMVETKEAIDEIVSEMEDQKAEDYSHIKLKGVKRLMEGSAEEPGDEDDESAA